MTIFLLFLIGLFIGSFLNVVIDRIPQKITIVKGRSRCDSCHHVLMWYDLIPVFSYTYLRGKCRYCHIALSLQYPVVEILTGILFSLSYILWIANLQMNLLSFFILIGIFATFFALSIMDIKYGILSDKLIIFATFLTIIFYAIQPYLFLPHLLVGISCFVLLFLLFILTRGRGIGFGDVKLSFVMGFFLGFPSIVIAFYLAFLTGAIVAIILVISKRKKFIGGTIAFGPFLLLGTYLAWYFGNYLWTFMLLLLGIA
ncbi:MAG TPA: prepilin peptidase [Patescibacteria group bacterium]